MSHKKSIAFISTTLIISLLFFFGCKKEKPEVVEEPKFFTPSELKASVFSDSTIRVNWKDNSNVEVSFELQRKDGTGSFKTVKETVANDTVFNDINVVPNILYTYRVRAKSKSAETSFSEEASVKLELPSPILTLLAIDDSKVKLTWTDNSVLETKFILERSENGQAFVVIAESGKNTQSYIDNTIVVNTEYRYRVKAINQFVETDYSNNAAIKLNFSAPTLSLRLSTENSIDLLWNDNSQFEKGYIIEQATNDGNFVELAKVDSPALSYKINNLQINKRYAFRVKAYSNKNTSAYSNIKKTYYNDKRYIITETYNVERAVEGQISLSPSKNLIATSSYYSKNIVLVNRINGAINTINTTHKEGTYSVKFSKDEKYIISTSAQDGNVEIWNINTRTLYKTITTGMEAAFCLAFNKSGNLLAVGGTGASKILIYNFPSMALKYILTTDNHNVRDLLFYDNDTKLISCGNDNNIKFWNLGSLQIEKTFTGHTGHIGTIDLNSNSSLLVSGSYEDTDKTIKIWNTGGGITQSIANQFGITSVFFDANDYIYSTDYGGHLRVISKSGDIAFETSVSSPILFADYNREYSIITLYSADGQINVLQRSPMWMEY
jgi:WD40 repeat protein